MQKGLVRNRNFRRGTDKRRRTGGPKMWSFGRRRFPGDVDSRLCPGERVRNVCSACRRRRTERPAELSPPESGTPAEMDTAAAVEEEEDGTVLNNGPVGTGPAAGRPRTPEGHEPDRTEPPGPDPMTWRGRERAPQRAECRRTAFLPTAPSSSEEFRGARTFPTRRRRRDDRLRAALMFAGQYTRTSSVSHCERL